MPHAVCMSPAPQSLFPTATGKNAFRNHESYSTFVALLNAILLHESPATNK